MKKVRLIRCAQNQLVVCHHLNLNVVKMKEKKNAKNKIRYSFACTMCDKTVLPTKKGQPGQSEKAQPSDQDISQTLASENHHVDGATEPGKRKRRKKSELTLSFACTMCNKTYDTSSALHTHQHKIHE